MSQKSIYNQLLIISCVAGVVGTAIVSSCGSLVSAQVQPESQQPVPLKPTRVKNPQELKLRSLKESFLPSDLEQSQNPREGTRGVIGKDNRIPMTSRKYPWSAIGRIQGVTANGENYHCTGTLVADDIVLTNAHCVIDPETHQYSQYIEFYPNLIDGNVRDQRDITYATSIYDGTDFKNSGVIDDWAFIKLNKPIGRRYGYLGLTSLPSSALIQKPKKLSFVGYSGDFPNPIEEKKARLGAGASMTASFQVGCSILGEEAGILLHDCDTTGGSSGAPIIAWIGQKPYIVALNNAEIKTLDGRPSVNLAVKISRIEQAINEK